MKKEFLLGIGLGAIVGFAIRKCEEKKFFERMYRNMNSFGARFRKRYIDYPDISEEEIEYMADYDNPEDKPRKDGDVLNEISY